MEGGERALVRGGVTSGHIVTLGDVIAMPGGTDIKALTWDFRLPRPNPVQWTVQSQVLCVEIAKEVGNIQILIEMKVLMINECV